jgi:hypothetical protein
MVFTLEVFMQNIASDIIFAEVPNNISIRYRPYFFAAILKPLCSAFLLHNASVIKTVPVPGSIDPFLLSYLV